MRRPLRVVYVTYDGLEDPLGQSQVLPYIEGLARRGHQFDIVSFEKPGARTRWREPLRDNVRWTALRYHHTPTVPATAFDMALGAAAAAWQALTSSADLIHARSYVPAALALPSVIGTGTPLIFDTRGLWADEKVDGGAWPQGDWKFHGAKRVERMLLRHSRAVVVITRSAQRYFRQEYPFAREIRGPIHVIHCATDLERFSLEVAPDQALASQLGGARVLGYVGSLGTWYMGATMARFYLEWRAVVRGSGAPDVKTRFLLVSRSDAREVRDVLAEAGVADELVTHAAPHSGVAGAIRWAEAALAFRAPTISSRAGSPVKIGEQLACGIPVVANVFGDVEDVFAGTRVAALLRSFDREALRRAAREIVAIAGSPGIREEARALACRWFDLDAAIDAYERLYETALDSNASRSDLSWPRPPDLPHP